MATPTLAERAAAAKARSLSTTTPAPVAPATAPPSLQERAAAVKARSLSTPAPKPPEVKATPAAKPEPVTPVVVAAPKAAPLPAPAPVVAPKPAPVPAFTYNAAGTATRVQPAPAPEPLAPGQVSKAEWQTMSESERAAAIANRKAQPGYTSTMERVAAEARGLEARREAAKVSEVTTKAGTFDLREPASFGDITRGMEQQRQQEEAAQAEASKPLLLPEGGGLLRTPDAQPKTAPTLKYRPEIAAASAFSMGPDGKPVMDWRMPTAEEQAQAEVQKGRTAIEEDLKKARANVALLRSGSQGSPMRSIGVLGSFMATSEDRLAAAEDEVRHLEALKSTGSDPLRKAASQDIYTTMPQDVADTIRGLDITAQRQGAEPMSDAEKQTLYESMVPEAQRQASMAFAKDTGQTEKPYRLEAIQREAAVTQPELAKAAKAALPANAPPQTQDELRTKTMQARANALLHRDGDKATQAFLQEEAEYFYVQANGNKKPPQEQAAARAEAREKAIHMLIGLRAEGGQTWPYEVYDRDLVPREDLTWGDYAEAFFRPAMETTPSGKSVRVEGYVGHAMKMAALPAVAIAPVMRKMLGDTQEFDLYSWARKKEGVTESVNLKAEELPRFKQMIEDANFSTPEGIANGYAVFYITATGAAVDVFGDIFTLGFGGFAAADKLRITQKAVNAGIEARRAGAVAEVVMNAMEGATQKGAFEIAAKLNAEADALPRFATQGTGLMDRARAAAIPRLRSAEVMRSVAQDIAVRATDVMRHDEGSRAVIDTIQDLNLGLSKEEAAAMPVAMRTLHPDAVKTRLTEMERRVTQARQELKVAEEARAAKVAAAKTPAEKMEAARTALVDIQAAKKKIVVTEEALKAVTAAPGEASRYDQVYGIASEEAARGMAEEARLTEGATQATPVSSLLPEVPAPIVPAAPSKADILAVFGEDAVTAGRAQRIITATSIEEALKAARVAGKNTDAVKRLAKDILAHIEGGDPAKAAIIKRVREADAVRVAASGGKLLPASDLVILQRTLNAEKAAARVAESTLKAATEAEQKVESLKRVQESTELHAAEKTAVDTAQKELKTLLDNKATAEKTAKLAEEIAAKNVEIDAATAARNAVKTAREEKAAAEAAAVAERKAAREQKAAEKAAAEAAAKEQKAAGAAAPPAEKTKKPKKLVTKAEKIADVPTGEPVSPDVSDMPTLVDALNPIRKQQLGERFDMDQLDFGPSGEPFLLGSLEGTWSPPPEYAARQQAHLAYLAFERDALANKDKAIGKYLLGAESANFAENFGLPHLNNSMSSKQAYSFTVSIDRAPPVPYTDKVRNRLREAVQAGNAPSVVVAEATLTPAANAVLDAIETVAAAHPERRRANTMNNFLRSLLPFSDVKAAEKDAHTLIRLEDQVRVDSVEAGATIQLYRMPRPDGTTGTELVPTPSAFVGKVVGFTEDGKVVVQPYEFKANSHSLDYTSPERFKPVTATPAEVRYQERGRVPRTDGYLHPMTNAEWDAVRAREDAIPGARTLRYEPSTTGWMEPLNPPLRPTKDSYHFEIKNIANEADRNAASAALEEAKAKAAFRGVPTPSEEEAALFAKSAEAKPAPEVVSAPEAAPAPEAVPAPEAAPAPAPAPTPAPAPAPVPPTPALPAGPRGKIAAKVEPPLIPAGPSAADIAAKEFELAAAQARLAAARGQIPAKAVANTGVLADRLKAAELAAEEARRIHIAARAEQVAAEGMGAAASSALTAAQEVRQPVAAGLEQTRLGEEARAAFIARRDRARRVMGMNAPQPITPARAIYEQQVRAVYARLARSPAEADAQLQATNAIAETMHAQYPDEFPTTDAVYARAIYKMGTKEQQAAEAAKFLAGTAPESRQAVVAAEAAPEAVVTAEAAPETVVAAEAVPESGQAVAEANALADLTAAEAALEAFHQAPTLADRKAAWEAYRQARKTSLVSYQKARKAAEDAVIAEAASAAKVPADQAAVDAALEALDAARNPAEHKAALAAYQRARAAVDQAAADVAASRKPAFVRDPYVTSEPAAGFVAYGKTPNASGMTEEAAANAALEAFHQTRNPADRRAAWEAYQKARDAAEAKKLPHMTGTTLRGMADTADGTRTILTFFANANAETLVHEPGHFLELVLPKKPKAIIEQALGVVDGNWTREQSEMFARQYTAFLFNGRVTGNEGLDRAYATISNSLKEIIKDGAAEVIHKDIQQALEDLTAFTPGVETRVVGGGGNRDRLVRALDIRTADRLITQETSLGAKRRRAISVVSKIRDVLFVGTQERALRALAPEVRRVVETSNAEFDDLNKHIGKALGKEDVIAAVLDNPADPTWWNAFRDAVSNDSMTERYKSVAFANVSDDITLTELEQGALLKIVRDPQYETARALQDALYTQSELIVKGRSAPGATAVPVSALRPPVVGEAMFAQAVGGLGIDQNLLKRGFGIGMTISADSAKSANTYLRGAEQGGSSEGMRIVQNAIDDPFNYVAPIGELSQAELKVSREARKPFDSAGKFGTSYATALAGEVYVPAAVRNMMDKRWGDIAAAQKLSPGGWVALAAWKQSLTAGYACVKPWYHWQNMMSDIEQIGSHIGLEAGARTAAGATLHSLVLGLGGQRVASAAADVAIIGTQKLASKLQITTWFQNKTWEMGDTMKELDKALGFGAFGKPTTDLIERNPGKFVTKKGITYDNAELSKLWGGMGFDEAGLGQQNLISQLQRENVQGAIARGEVSVGGQVWHGTKKAVQMNAKQIGDIASMISRRRKYGLGLTLLDMGYEPLEAGKLVQGALYNMKHTLHDSEKNLWSMFNPFWAWKKNNAARSVTDALAPGGLSRMHIINETRKKGAQMIGYMLQDNPPTGFDLRAVAEDDRDRPENGKQLPKLQAILDSLHKPSAAYPNGLTDYDIKQMLKTPGWNDSTKPISALAPYAEQYFVVNPTQEMLPSYVWDTVAIYATIPRTSDNFRLYTGGEGKKAQTFDQGRAIVLPEDVNFLGLEYAASVAEAAISAYALVQHDPGAKAAFIEKFKDAAGDPSANPAFIFIVNGALGLYDPKNPPRGVNLAPEVGEALSQWGGEILARQMAAATDTGEGGGEDINRVATWEMPWMTASIVNSLGFAPALQAAGTVKTISQVGGMAALTKPSADLGYSLLELETGQKTMIGSATKQNAARDWAAQRRIEAATENVKRAQAILPDARPALAAELQVDMRPSLLAYYGDTGTPAKITALAVNQRDAPGTAEGTAAREMFDTWQEWAKVRRQVGIPAEQSNKGTFEQFYTVYRDRAASGASQSDLKNLMAELDYGKYTQ